MLKRERQEGGTCTLPSTFKGVRKNRKFHKPRGFLYICWRANLDILESTEQSMTAHFCRRESGGDILLTLFWYFFVSPDPKSRRSPPLFYRPSSAPREGKERREERARNFCFSPSFSPPRGSKERGRARGALSHSFLPLSRRTNIRIYNYLNCAKA